MYVVQIAVVGLNCMLLLSERALPLMDTYQSTVLPVMVDRLADSKDQVI